MGVFESTLDETDHEISTIHCGDKLYTQSDLSLIPDR